MKSAVEAFGELNKFATGEEVSFDYQIGEQVNEATYWYYIEVLPPSTMTADVIQIGEPQSHDGAGLETYDTIKRADDKTWIYAGHLNRQTAKGIKIITPQQWKEAGESHRHEIGTQKYLMQYNDTIGTHLAPCIVTQ